MAPEIYMDFNSVSCGLKIKDSVDQLEHQLSILNTVNNVMWDSYPDSQEVTLLDTESSLTLTQL